MNTAQRNTIRERLGLDFITTPVDRLVSRIDAYCEQHPADLDMQAIAAELHGGLTGAWPEQQQGGRWP
jgi:hypothetical protein